MGRLSSVCSVNCCFLTTLILLAALAIPLFWPGPNQTLITAIQRKEYRLIHTLVEAELARIDTERAAQATSLQQRTSLPKATVDDVTFSSGRGVMHVAALHGDVAILKYFHKRGASLETRKDGDERTPLFFAAAFNTLEVVRQLVEWGAVVDARAEAGWTPLLKAVLLSNHDIVEYLLSVGADPNLHVDRSFNALQCAIIYSDERMIFLLLKAGAYVEEGEPRYDDYVEHRNAVLRAGLLTEEDMARPRPLHTVTGDTMRVGAAGPAEAI